MSQRGAISLPTIIAIALGLGFSASAYLNYSQYQRTQQDEKLLTGEISDLKYQVGQDHLATGASPSPSPSPSGSPDASTTAAASPTPSTAVLPASTSATKTISKQGNIHSGPSTNSSTLVPYTNVSVGAQVTLVGGATGAYQQINYNGTTGYIESADLQ